MLEVGDRVECVSYFVPYLVGEQGVVATQPNSRGTCYVKFDRQAEFKFSDPKYMLVRDLAKIGE